MEGRLRNALKFILGSMIVLCAGMAAYSQFSDTRSGHWGLTFGFMGWLIAQRVLSWRSDVSSAKESKALPQTLTFTVWVGIVVTATVIFSAMCVHIKPENRMLVDPTFAWLLGIIPWGLSLLVLPPAPQVYVSPGVPCGRAQPYYSNQLLQNTLNVVVILTSSDTEEFMIHKLLAFPDTANGRVAATRTFTVMSDKFIAGFAELDVAARSEVIKKGYAWAPDSAAHVCLVDSNYEDLSWLRLGSQEHTSV